jgi:S1-C subfamily serine protease
VFALTGGGGKAKKSTASSGALPLLSAQQLVSRTSPAAISLSGRQGTGVFGGTGVVVDKERGLVITNAHVVSGLSALKARMSNGAEVPVRVLGQAPCDDLAVLQLTNVPAGSWRCPSATVTRCRRATR